AGVVVAFYPVKSGTDFRLQEEEVGVCQIRPLQLSLYRIRGKGMLLRVCPCKWSSRAGVVVAFYPVKSGTDFRLQEEEVGGVPDKASTLSLYRISFKSVGSEEQGDPPQKERVFQLRERVIPVQIETPKAGGKQVRSTSAMMGHCLVKKNSASPLSAMVDQSQTEKQTAPE
ncbi:hypothetical protein KUCAC02_033325, partial [Chaenocephalus aceratus]